MADLEDVTLDGRPLQSLRVADLKAALEERGLSKSGQKNALVKRLKGALMLENLQRTSTAQIGLQPNSQISEEMSQNSFIKQYLAKQQELLRQRLEKEAREAFETNDQEGHAEVNNSTLCPPQVQDVTPALPEQHKPPGPSGEAVLFGSGNEVEGNRNEETDMSGPPASGSVAMRVSSGDHRPERGSTSSEVAADSDDEDSEDGEEDADDDDWDSSARRRSLREPARVPTTRERSGASCQPQQQHIPSLLSPQLRQPTPPPSPPPELSFPLPDTPKQSPPSPDVAPGRRSPSSSSSGSSSSGSRSSSPEPQRSGPTERKPGPLTLLARKMESEGAFSGAGWHGGVGEGDGQDSSLPSGAAFPARGPLDGHVSAVSHTTKTAGNVPGPMNPGRSKGIIGGHPTHSQIPVSILKSTATEERESEVVREAAFELERQEKQRKLQERAMELEWERTLALEREEKQRALEKEMLEHQQALEREEQEKALQKERERQERELALEQERHERELALERERKERELALEQERQERELALERERQERELALEQERRERELALERERQLALERERQEKELALAKEKEEREQALARERALEQERLQREREEKERQEKERAMELERARALEREREERERALEQERLDRERALEAERKKKERIERELALEKERLEKERLEREKLEREKALEEERIKKEKALEQERLERERALEQERLERERVLEQERLERERVLEQERIKREEALERERVNREKVLEQERREREKAIEQEKLEKERVLEQERLEMERALEQERLEREKAEEQERLERDRKEKERVERERLEQERIEREKALELEKERAEREAALEKERAERERVEKEEMERLGREKALEQERLEIERALEKERKEKERAVEEQREKALKQERLNNEKAMQKEEQETFLVLEQEPALVTEKEKESCLPPAKRGCEIDPAPLPTTSLLSTGPARKSLSEAGEQDDVHSPISRSETQVAETDATMLPTPMSPHSSFKKFRFLRDSPVQPQSSSTTIVIKRPRTFSDTPQPQALPVVSPISVGEQQQEGHQPAGKLGDPQVPTNPEGSPGSLGIQSEEEMASSKEQADSVKTQPSALDCTKKIKEVDDCKSLSTPVDVTQQEGRDVNKEEKTTRKRLSSSDSSSSDSDSGSSSSRSSRSSVSSQEETPISRGRRVGKSGRDSSPQQRITDEAGGGGSAEAPKATPQKRQKSGDDVNTTADGHSHIKKPFTDSSTQEETQRKRKDSEREEEEGKQRQVTDTAMAEPEKIPENCEETPKSFSARKISLSGNKLSPGTSSAEGDQESGAAAGRKRRWGSSTAVTAKKPSISITTDSLKSLIPDIRPCLGQEAVVDLHPEEAVLSGIEEEEKEHSDQDLQIRRTVTQVVHSESQENGQKEAKRTRLELEQDLQEERETTRIDEEKIDTSFPEAVETQSPSNTSHDVEISTVTPGDTLVRRSISQQKTGVSITIDDPVRTSRQPSPPRGKVSNIVHVCNLVRPFTLGQLKELLRRTGTLVEEGFWIDKIKSHCYVTYSSSEEAVATRAALHGVKWPQSNPKVLSVDFCLQDELDFHKGLGGADRPGAEDQGPGPVRGRTSGLPSLLPERDQWTDREREMERREKTRAEREWDRDKVREFGKLGGEKEGGPRRSRSRERRRKERGKSKEKKTEKKEKTAEDPPAKLLDDLFCKTKAAPCIYWLPLTDEQFVQREAARAERMKEREKRRKEQEAEEEKKREEERKERMKTGGGTTGDRSEGEKDKDRERDRDRERGRDRERERENDKRRDGYRRPGGSGAGSGRRSRSRSDPRERRR